MFHNNIKVYNNTNIFHYFSILQHLLKTDIKIQKNSHNMIDISSLMVNQKKESNYDFFQYCDGSALGRNNINIIMNGNGSNCNLSGISLTKNIQQIDNNIVTPIF